MDFCSSQTRKLFIGNVSGIFLEYFDYTLYGFAASHIATHYFPPESHATALIMTWLVFALGFLVRPIGAFIFGHFADRFGRRKTLLCTIALGSFPTLGIGLLPSYQSIGLASTILLICFRMIQGFSVSTEYPGASTYLLETYQNTKGFISGLTTSFGSLGIFFASLTTMLFALPQITVHIPAQQSWRIPFILGGFIVGLLGIYLRKKMPESPAFLKIIQQQAQSKNPVALLFRHYLKQFTRMLLISTFLGVSIYTVMVFNTSYFKEQLHFSSQHALAITTTLSLIEAIAAIAFGYLSDYFNRRFFLGFMLLLMLCFAIPCYNLISIGTNVHLFIGAITLVIIIGGIDGPMAAFMYDEFPTKVRYSGFAITYSLGAAVIGGITPFILTWLLTQSNNLIIPGIYLAAFALLALAVVILGFNDNSHN